MSHGVLLVAVEGPGSEIKDQVAWEMGPFYREDEYFTGVWRYDWYVIGGTYDGMLGGKNIVQVADLNLEKVREVERLWAEQAWEFNGAMLMANQRPSLDALYQDGDTRETYISRAMEAPVPHACVFLSNRYWHEGERFGIFRLRPYPKCRIADEEEPKVDTQAWFGKCLYGMDDEQAHIVHWNEPREVWRRRYYKRFIEPLPKSRYLVVVEYHV